MKSRMGWGFFIAAVWIHNSILSFAPALLGIWLAKKCRTYTRLYLLSFFIAIAFAIGLMEIAIIFSNLFPHYEIYTQGTINNNLIENTGGGKIIVAYISFLIVLLIYYIENRSEKKIKYNLNNTFLFGAIFCVVLGIGSASNTMVNRIVLPYQCFFLSLIPYIFSRFREENKYFLGVIMLAGLSVYYYLWAKGNLGDVLPYNFWL